jgi:hypothetical protein
MFKTSCTTVILTEAEGVVGIQPKRGSHWAYKFGSISVLLDGERLTL